MADSKRDEKGLIPANAKDMTQKESNQRAKYTKTLTRLHLFIAPTIAFVVYALMSKFIPGQAELFKQKFEFINKYQLQYMYFAFYIFMIPRIYAMINSNATRAPCRLDRPDQHIYKIQAKKTNKQFADAPYVLMDNEGVNGVFNRAQRAAFWLDENLTQICCLCILTAPVFGPVVKLAVGVTFERDITFYSGIHWGVESDGALGRDHIEALPRHPWELWLGMPQSGACWSTLST